MNADKAAIRAKEQLFNLLSQLPQGARLPGERTLSEEFGVCRVTLRRALEDFISDGRLERRARSGTYIKRPMISSEMRLKSFTEEIKARGQQPSSSLISFKKTKASLNVSKLLRINQGEEIFLVTRLRLADHMPVALETLRIACNSIPNLTPEDFKGSIYDVLFEKSGIRIMSARAGITAHNPSERDRNLLKTSLETPCLLIKMLDFNQFGKPVMTAECLYRSDLFELQIEVSATIKETRGQRVS
ncbi:MAG: GntR family transcriptional regulator [Candidatus Nanopelagicaceae bacterium]|jgi:GntR family transcriptional regulator